MPPAPAPAGPGCARGHISHPRGPGAMRRPGVCPTRGPRCGGDARGVPHPGATRGVALPGSARPRGTTPVVDARGRPTPFPARGRWASHISRRHLRIYCVLIMKKIDKSGSTVVNLPELSALRPAEADDRLVGPVAASGRTRRAKCDRPCPCGICLVAHLQRDVQRHCCGGPDRGTMSVDEWFIPLESGLGDRSAWCLVVRLLVSNF